MSAKIIDGKKISLKVRAKIKEKVSLLTKKNRPPFLAVLLAGTNPSSLSYVKGKEKALQDVGMCGKTFYFEEEAGNDEVAKKIKELNNSDEVDGILLQLPLPSGKGYEENRLLSLISPEKDVDGFSSANTAALFREEEEAIIPCTPLGIMRLLDEYAVQTAGKRVVIIGRSAIVGKPLALLLSAKKRNATVTLCHSATQNLETHTKEADILICAAGCPSLVKANMIKKGAVVIDVGINRIKDETKKNGYALVGDVDGSVWEKASLVTPVPGGVGPMTVALLLENTLTLYERRLGL